MDAAKTISILRRADECHLRKSALSSLHPAAHLIAALSFIVAVLSRGGDSLSGLVPFLLYQVAVMLFGEIPFKLVAPRVALVLPFVAMIGASNLFLAADKSAGWVSFFAICIKCVLCASSALLLVCVCGIGGITLALDFLRVPKLLVAQFSFTYRYLYILAEETASVMRAHALRSSGHGVSLKQFGPICGGMFLRSMKRADAIYAAMLCRGFTGAPPAARRVSFSRADAAWMVCWLSFFAVCALCDIPAFLGNLILGAYKMNVIVEAHGLAYEYDGSIPALTGADFLLRESESLALIGANGAGKSTLLQLLVGVLAPKSGELRFNGAPVSKKNLAAVRGKIGFVFQSAEHQLFCNTVLEDVMFGPLNAGLPHSEAAARADEVLCDLGITHLAQRAPYRLSAGERRLCAIAGVLSMRPDILLMDEPTSELDPRARRELIALLGRLPQAKIIATHDLDFAVKTCPRAMILHGGRVAADGASEVLLEDEALLAALGL